MGVLAGQRRRGRCRRVAACVGCAAAVLLLGAPAGPAVDPTFCAPARAASSGGPSFAAGARTASQRSPLFPARAAAAAQVPAAQAAVASIWAKTGLGPLFIAAWVKLSPYPPFTYLAWMYGHFINFPKFYRYYLMYSLGSFLAKKLFPSLYAQLFSGTWLGVLKTANYDMYVGAVSMRLRDLLTKQAKLRGVTAPMSPDTLTALSEQLKGDRPLAEALGSTTTLGIWHKLEKSRLDSKELLDSFPAESQARWVIEQLQTGYLGDIETMGRESAVTSAAEAAAKKLRALSDAVQVAATGAAYNAYGTDKRGSLAQVQKTADEAGAAVKKLQEAAKRPTGEIAAERNAWEAKLAELETQHADVPAVAEELARLRAAAAEVPRPPLAGRLTSS